MTTNKMNVLELNRSLVAGEKEGTYLVSASSGVTEEVAKRALEMGFTSKPSTGKHSQSIVTTFELAIPDTLEGLAQELGEEKVYKLALDQYIIKRQDEARKAMLAKVSGEIPSDCQKFINLFSDYPEFIAEVQKMPFEQKSDLNYLRMRSIPHMTARAQKQATVKK